MHAFSKKGDRLWEYDIQGAKPLTPALPYKESVYLLASTKDDPVFAEVHCLTSKGDLKWKTSLFDQPVVSWPVVAENGSIIVATMNQIHCLDHSGKSNWIYEKPESGPANLALGPDGTLYYAQIGRLQALDSSGSPIWNHPMT